MAVGVGWGRGWGVLVLILHANHTALCIEVEGTSTVMYVTYL